MAGKYNGVQQKILDEKKFAKFIPCAAHSLNLVGRAAVDSCLDAVNFLAWSMNFSAFSLSLQNGGQC